MMNKRIRELAEQCSSLGKFDVEKFANLVLCEAFRACTYAHLTSRDKTGKLRDEAYDMCMDEIRNLRSDL